MNPRYPVAFADWTEDGCLLITILAKAGGMLHVLMLRSDATFMKFEVKFRVSVPLKAQEE